jgi:hypothetical protein
MIPPRKSSGMWISNKNLYLQFTTKLSVSLLS